MTHPILLTGAAGRVGVMGDLVSRLVPREFLVVIELVAAKG